MSKDEYKVIASFYYRGEEGKDEESVIIAPGENVPKLSKDIINTLLLQQKIAKISEVDGTIIKHNRLEDLSDKQIKTLLSKSDVFIRGQLKNRYFSNDTLSKIYTQAEKMKLNETTLRMIENKIEGVL